MKYYLHTLLLCFIVQVGSCLQPVWSGVAPVMGKSVDAACLEPKLIGPCRAQVPRYYYNPRTQDCESFFYGGCGGNANNFESIDECNSKCGGRRRAKQSSVCEGPPQEGPSCEGIVLRWTFNTSTQECVQFIYNGCGATANNFHTKIDCQLQCGDKSSCQLPQSAGPCYADIKQWWFDADNGKCSEFIYGGCGGNSNRYKSLTECEAVCKSTSAKQVEQNPCDGVKCPGGISHYTELGCKPVYDDGACCPTRFECPEREVEKNSDQCIYKGKIYNSGDAVPSADSGSACRAGCTCNTGEINCAYVECPELFGYFPKPGCHISQYKPDQCCAYDYACGNETAICEFEGEKYLEGQKIYPKDEPCLVCYCKPGFNGTLSTEYCHKIDCGIEIWYASYMQRGCTPIYFQNNQNKIGCCPISWRCPDDLESEGTAEETGNKIMEAEATPAVGQVARSTGPPETKALADVQRVISLEENSFSCDQPKAEGNCQARRLRYFYNTTSNQCEEFEYTGCGGNGNNYLSIEQCSHTCAKQEQDLMGRFGSVKLTIKTLVVTKDPCTEEPRTGRCKAYFRRFYYDPQTNTCKLFIYGGCQRNGNNFYTKESCEATCVKVYPNVCASKPQDLIRDCGYEKTNKFYYDPEDGYCKQFVSTGCTTNNAFNRLVECDSVCGIGKKGLPQRPQMAVLQTVNSRENICLLPRHIGTCLANVPSYYYDVIAKSCKSFLYGGCFGNANRFARLDDCKRTCEIDYDEKTGVSGRTDGGSIAFVDRRHVEEQPNEMIFSDNNMPRRRDILVTVSPASHQALNETMPVAARLDKAEHDEDEDSPKKIEADDSSFIFGRMFMLNQKPNTDSSKADGVGASSIETEDGEIDHSGSFIMSTTTTQPPSEDSTLSGSDEVATIIDSEETTSRDSLSQTRILERESESIRYVVGTTHPSPVLSPEVAYNENFTLPQDSCSLDFNLGSCNQTILRFHWDGNECRPFNYTGCGGNANRFVSEFECKRTCGSNFEDLSQGLHCTFGNRVIPFGTDFDESEKCGSQFCTCSVPPSLSCTIKVCTSNTQK